MRVKTILMVEDDPIIAADVASTLCENGYQVVRKDTVELALQWLSTELADLAIINFLENEHPQGTTTARLIRSRFLTPVLLMTGARLTDLRVADAFYGGQDFLIKPFTTKQLIEQVCKVLTTI